MPQLSRDWGVPQESAARATTVFAVAYAWGSLAGGPPGAHGRVIRPDVVRLSVGTGPGAAAPGADHRQRRRRRQRGGQPDRGTGARLRARLAGGLPRLRTAAGRGGPWRSGGSCCPARSAPPDATPPARAVCGSCVRRVCCACSSSSYPCSAVSPPSTRSYSCTGPPTWSGIPARCSGCGPAPCPPWCSPPPALGRFPPLRRAAASLTRRPTPADGRQRGRGGADPRGSARGLHRTARPRPPGGRTARTYSTGGRVRAGCLPLPAADPQAAHAE